MTDPPSPPLVPPAMTPPAPVHTPDMGRRACLRWAAGALAATWLSHPRPARAQPPDAPIRVHLWSEGTASRSVYPDDIDGALASDLRQRSDMVVTTGRLDDPDAGLPDAILDASDTLVWWGRLRHEDVPDARAAAVVERVRAGRLGLLALHTSFASKPFRALMGTTCAPNAWRIDGRPEHVQVADPNHPIARGVAPFVVPRSSSFTEPFTVPEPDAVVLRSTWDNGESFRSGLTWTIGQGRVAYLRPGHDSIPDLFQPAVRQLIANAIAWTARRT